MFEERIYQYLTLGNNILFILCVDDRFLAMVKITCPCKGRPNRPPITAAVGKTANDPEIETENRAGTETERGSEM